MFGSYAIVFCRWVLLITFGWSVWGKIQDIPAFSRTIQSFQVIPKQFIRPASFACILAEGLVTGFMLVGGPFLLPGFVIAAGLFFVFGVALFSVTHRKIKTSCNCFGFSKNEVAIYEILRDGIFLLCAVSGGIVLVAFNPPVSILGLGDWSVCGMAGLFFVFLLVQARKIIWLFTTLQRD
jgi:hypothetical protein